VSGAIDLERESKLPASVVSAALARRPLPLAERECVGCGETIVYDGARVGFVHPGVGAAYRQRCDECKRTFDIHPRARFCPWCGSDRVAVDHEARPARRDMSEALHQLDFGRRRARGGG